MRKKYFVWILMITLLFSSGFGPVDAFTIDHSKKGTTITESATTESATTESATTESATTESATTESATTETVLIENETVQTDIEENTISTETTTETKTELSTTEQENKEEFEVSTLNPMTAKVVVLDPGHCGLHPGAMGNGLREEVVVMDISRYCQKALNRYGDVTVYMTREDGSCCRNLNLGGCLIGRNYYAKILSADFLVSMHINAGWTNGANLLVAYDSGYHSEIADETQKFGRIALKELKKLGIVNRGFLLRKSNGDMRYKNGALADYYSIVRNGVILEIPSVIIEHGYITSASDCNKFFRKQSQRKKLGTTDAKAIVNYYDLNKKVIDGKFKEENGDIYYIDHKSKKVTGWVKFDGKWYYLDEKTAKLKTGFFEQNGSLFYLRPSDGQMQVGWFSVDGTKYLAKGNGTLVTNEIYTDGIYSYIFDENSKCIEKEFYDFQGKTYYLNKYGQMAKGMKKIKGNYYYFSKTTGVMVKNKIVKVKGSRYYFNEKGIRKTGLVSYKKNKYYFDKKTAKMVKGWKKIKGNYYYFHKSNGKMQKNKRIGKYFVNSKGIRRKRK